MSIVPALPYTLQNGQPADANQVMSNYNTIRDGVNNNAAANGANSDITSLSGLTTPLSTGQGGTGVNDGSNLLPPGVMLPFAGPTAPSGFLLCAGQAVSRTTYVALFNAIGTAWGAGDGSTTFNVPDMRGRVAAGLDNMGGTAANRITSGGSGIAGTTLGAAGGNELMQQHLHAVTDPTHTHGVNDPTHMHSFAAGVPAALPGSGLNASGSPVNEAITGTEYAATGISIQSHATGITIQNAGSGSSQNTQPTAMANYIIKT